MSKLPNPNGGYWYGGANKLNDANNVSYIGGIAARDDLSGSDPARFRFEVHRIGGNGALTWLPLEDGNLTGKGMLYVDHSTGQGRYTSTIGKVSYDGPIPGFAPFSRGGYASAPNGSIRVFADQDGFTGQVAINLAPLGVPVCSALNVRLALDAAPGAVFRCGPPISDPNLQAAAMLSVAGLGVAVRAYESGVIAASAARTLLVKAEAPIARGFVDVFGWWV